MRVFVCLSILKPACRSASYHIIAAHKPPSALSGKGVSAKAQRLGPRYADDRLMAPSVSFLGPEKSQRPGVRLPLPCESLLGGSATQ